MCSPFGVGTSRFHYSNEEMFVDTVYLGAYRRKVFDRIGLYDEKAHYSEDDELNYRLIKNGGKILLSPKIRSRYVPRSSLLGLWKQYFNYGRGKVRTIRKYGRPPSLAHLAPVIFVLLTAASLILWHFMPIFGWGFFFIAGSYGLGAGIASVVSGSRCSWAVSMVLPLFFLTMHAGYGVGMLVGFFRLIILGKVWS
jgi:GT2 family glycosyltransferase